MSSATVASSPQPAHAGLNLWWVYYYCTAVERDFARTRRLEDYASTLGYSARTLSRATHSDRTAAQIAAWRGFSSATNLSKYFHQRVGTTPVAFRTSIRGTAFTGGGATTA